MSTQRTRASGSAAELYRIDSAADRRACVLASGATLIVQHHDAAPVVAVRFYVRGGSTFEGELAGSGVTHLLEHVVTGDAAAGRSESEIFGLTESIGGLSNAYTSHDHICYHITAAREHLEMAVDLLAGWVLKPALSAEVFRREVGVVQRELERDRDDPDVQLEEILHDALYAGHPMRHPIIGHRDALLRLTHEDLVSHYRRTHMPQNIVAVVVGDTDVDATMRCLQTALTPAQRGPLADSVLGDPQPIQSPRRVLKPMKVASTSVTFAWRTVRETDRDDAALDLLSSILTEGNGSRLVRSLRWDRPLVYELDGAHETTWHTAGMFQVSADMALKNLETVETAVLAELERVRSEGISEDELTRARRQGVVATRLQRQTAEGWAAQIGEDVLATGDPNYTQAYIERINRSTAADLVRACGEHLRPETRVVAAITPATRRRPPAPARASDNGSATQQHVLNGGLRCLVHPIRSSAFVALNILFPGGTRAESESSNGIFNLMTEALPRGTRSRAARQIAEFFDASGTLFRAGTAADAFGLDLLAPMEEFEPALEVFADVALRPAFDPLEIDKLRPSICDAIERLDEDWSSEIARFSRRCMFEQSPYRFIRFGSIDNVRRFSAADLHDVHGRFCVGRDAVISVAGALDPGRVCELILRHFEAMPMRSSGPLPQPPPEPASTSDRLYIRRTAEAREVAGLFVGFHGHRATDREHRAAMTVLATMLVGYSLSGGRLFTALRGGARDIAYEVSGGNYTGLLPGYFGITAGCEPSRIREAYDIICREIQQLRNGEFEDTELQRAKAVVVAGELDQLQTPGDFARRAAADELSGLGADDWQSFLADVRTVQREAVVRAAQRFLTHAVVAIVTPRPAEIDLGLAPTRIEEPVHEEDA